MADHRIYGKRYFKYNYHVFSVFKAKPLEWWLYARHEAQQYVTFLGKIKRDVTELSDCRLDYSMERGRDKLFDIATEQFKVLEKMDNIVERLEKRSYLCNNTTMPAHENTYRNRKIVEYIDRAKKRGVKVSYTDVAKLFNLKAKSTVAHIYHRDRKKYGKKKVIHSSRKRSLVPFVVKGYTKSTKR